MRQRAPSHLRTLDADSSYRARDRLPRAPRTSPMALLQKLDAKAPVTVLVTGAAGQIAYK